MKIHISKNGQNIGQFELSEVNRMLQSGQISSNDLAWQEGMANWIPVGTMPGLNASVPPIPGSNPPPLRHGSIAAAPTSIPNYLVQSILVTLFCCLPLGIVAIINASQVNNKISAGDIAGAMEASQKAKKWCFWSLGIGLGAMLIYFLLAILTAVASSN
jgi:hypothetical protein